MFKEKISRRQFFEVTGALTLLYVLFGKFLPEVEAQDWPTDKEGILKKIKELRFPHDAQLRTTFFPRKVMWEYAQLLKQQGKWQGNSDESDWLSHMDILDTIFGQLEKVGIKGARLEMVPFEVTKDGQIYDWSPVDQILDLMKKHHMVADLCIGPINFPYDPGARFPIVFQDKLNAAFKDAQTKQIIISMQTDPNFPQLSGEIRDYALQFVQQITGKYGKDQRVDKFYLGNEWPDTNNIEGVAGGTIRLASDFMQEAIKNILAATDKRIALNTNVPPSDLDQMKQKLGALLNQLGARGVLGLDPYPTQEAQDPTLAPRMKDYGKYVTALRQTFPQTEVIFTEYQAEPWPPQGVAGKSWVDIVKQNPNVITDFYLKAFPQNLAPYMSGAQIKEIGLWGAPVWPVMAALGDDFPYEMFSALNEAMQKSCEPLNPSHS